MTEARKDRRAPASIKVKYKSASMTEFVELLGGDVSRGGIFIKTKKPLEPGSLLKFEFQLQNGEPMISGVGRVAWRRTEEGARPTLPAGMGIKFIKLNGQSRAVIDRIEAKHGPGSRFEQTDGAEIATSLSSLPPGTSSATFNAVSLSEQPVGAGTLITPLRPEATRAAAEADAAVTPRLRSDSANLNSPGRYSLTDSGRPTRSSPPLREAKASGPKPSAAMAATFRPPPPAADSVPPSHSSAPPASAASARAGSAPLGSGRASARTTFNRSSSGAFASPSASSPAAATGALANPSAGAPRGVLGSGVASRRSGAAVPSSRSAARDASEFLASAFTVGGAGREVRSEAHAQVERARHDPHSVDLANELFGDLNEPSGKPEANTALDADPILSGRALNAAASTAANTAETRRPAPPVSDPNLAASAANDVGPRISQPLRTTTPRPTANDQLKLSLGAGTTVRPGAGGGRALWLGVIVIVGLGIGAAVYYVQRGGFAAVPAPATEVAAPAPAAPAPQPAAAPAEAPPTAAEPVDWSLSSEPPGAEVTADGVAAGTTPATLKLTPGKTVQLSLRSPGYVTKTESLEVTPDMPARTLALERMPYELVVKEPVGATVKALDKSVEAPAPLNLGVLFSAPNTPGAISVSIEKPGFQRATRKLTRADFQERDNVLRAELSFSLTPLSAAAAAKAAAAKAPVVNVTPAAPAAPAPGAPAVKDTAAAPPEPQAPPEPEAPAAEDKPAPPAAKEKQAAEPPPAAPQVESPAPEHKPAPPVLDPGVPAEP